MPTGNTNDTTELERLRLAIEAGAAALDRGDFDEVDEADLDAYLDALAPPARG